jgi:hypothetical protein
MPVDVLAMAPDRKEKTHKVLPGRIQLNLQAEIDFG